MMFYLAFWNIDIVLVEYINEHWHIADVCKDEAAVCTGDQDAVRTGHRCECV